MVSLKVSIGSKNSDFGSRCFLYEVVKNFSILPIPREIVHLLPNASLKRLCLSHAFITGLKIIVLVMDTLNYVRWDVLHVFDGKTAHQFYILLHQHSAFSHPFKGHSRWFCTEVLLLLLDVLEKHPAEKRVLEVGHGLVNEGLLLWILEGYIVFVGVHIDHWEAAALCLISLFDWHLHDLLKNPLPQDLTKCLAPPGFRFFVACSFSCRIRHFLFYNVDWVMIRFAQISKLRSIPQISPPKLK